jgi:ABC-type microcin C transport system permease subunit YejB
VRDVFKAAATGAATAYLGTLAKNYYQSINDKIETGKLNVSQKTADAALITAADAETYKNADMSEQQIAAALRLQGVSQEHAALAAKSIVANNSAEQTAVILAEYANKSGYQVMDASQNKDAIANSARLGIAATTVGVSIGLTIGIFAALRPGGKRDVAVNTAAFVGISIPPYISAILLQLLFAVYWSKWFGSTLFPTSGVYPPGQDGFDLTLMIKHMALPTFVVAIQIIAVYSRYMRSSLLDVLNSAPVVPDLDCVNIIPASPPNLASVPAVAFNP